MFYLIFTICYFFLKHWAGKFSQSNEQGQIRFTVGSSVDHSFTILKFQVT